MRWLVFPNYVRSNSFPEEQRKESVACAPWFSWSVRMIND
jgi:hypothetical protein